jgi:transposase InsO family protein
MVAVADQFAVSLRTLRNWRHLDPAEQVARPGRPCLAEEERQRDLVRVRSVLDELGWGRGEQTVWEALERSVSRARVRHALRELKRAKRSRARAVRREARVSTRVRMRDAMWCLDATHLGRDRTGRAVQAEVLRDVGSAMTLRVSIGYAATAEEVVDLLEREVARRRGAPLVLVHDNGAAYAAQRTRSWCADHGVLQLFSLPRTPQHNAIAERGIRDLKEDSGLGDEVVGDIVEVRDRLARSVERIDALWPRPSKGGQTLRAVHAAMPSWRGQVDRGAIYEAATCAIRKAVLDCDSARARRVATRGAIHDTLEAFHVINRNRGPRCEVRECGKEFL